MNKFSQTPIIFCLYLQADQNQDLFTDESHEIRPEELFNDSESQPSSPFENLINSEGFFEPLNLILNKSPADILLFLLKFSFSNSLTLSGICQLLKLVNNLFDADVLPTSEYFVNKYFNPDNKTEYHALCSNEECMGYLGKIENFNQDIKCPVCQKTKKISKTSHKNFFVIIDPSVTIKNIVNRYDKFYDDVVSNENHRAETIEDIYDGQKYKEFVSSLPPDQKKSYLSCIVNTDGANPFKSSKSSLWPIQIMINEIPVTARLRNIVTCGLWFGRGKPNMAMYLKPFVDLFNQKLSKIGIDCIINGEQKNLKMYCISCVVDSPARAPIQGVKQYNGTYGCNWCLIPGEILDTCRYSFLSPNTYPERNHRATVDDMIMVAETGTPSENGVNNVSPFINFPYFDIIESFGLDYMHACLLGVGSRITKLILKT